MGNDLPRGDAHPVVSFRYNDIGLSGGAQMWSNAPAMWGERSIPAVLARPTFLSLVRLALIFGKSRLIRENAALREEGLLDAWRYDNNVFWLDGIPDDR